MAPIMTAANDNLDFFFFFFFFVVFQKKKILDISCESSAIKRINMKYQALFSSKDKCKKSVFCCNFAWLFKG